MRKQLLYLVTLLFAFSGCSDHEDELPALEKEHYLTRKVSTSIFTGGSKLVIDLRYAYNDKKQLTAITGTNTRTDTPTQPIDIKYSYDEQARLVRIQNSPKLYWTITYNEKNQVDKQIRTTVNSDNTTETHYYKNTYNAAGQRTTLQIRNIKGGVDEPGPIYTFTYVNGQAIFMHGELPGGGTYNDYTFTNDDKKVPLKGVYQLSVPSLIIQEIPKQVLSDHNLVAHAKTGSLEGNDYSFEATYQYNEAGYPISSVRMWYEGSIEIIDFTYSTLD